MPDDADELILKMQHLEAQARAQQEARAKQSGSAALKSAAQRLADDSRKQLEEAEAAEKGATGQAEVQEAHSRVVKARARLQFALDRMDEVERREWEALRAEARAETHGQLADDPLFKKP